MGDPVTLHLGRKGEIILRQLLCRIGAAQHLCHRLARCDFGHDGGADNGPIRDRGDGLRGFRRADAIVGFADKPKIPNQQGSLHRRGWDNVGFDQEHPDESGCKYSKNHRLRPFPDLRLMVRVAAL